MRVADNFLGGALKILQPQKGYRAGSDAVLLAAFLPENAKGTVLDVGCGVGTVSICAVHRLPHIKVTGIDCQQYLIEMAQENAHLNNCSGRTRFIVEDLNTVTLTPTSFDHVLTNPPYFENTAVSPDISRALARAQQTHTLEEWIAFCIKMAKPRGYISLIYPASGLDRVLKAMSRLGEIQLYPLWSKKGANANRCLVRGRKDVCTKSTLHAGLVLHEEDGAYTAAARSILWDGAGIPI